MLQEGVFFRMDSLPPFRKGLGQLEAFVGAEEGVAFLMDNALFWDSLCDGCQWTVVGTPEKRRSSKFRVSVLPSGKVMLRNWLGLYLAPVKIESRPKTFPIQAVLDLDDPSLYFDVFFSGNRIAFRAYNGLFLSRIYRDFDGLEAATFFTDWTCCFWPCIGDLTPPIFDILSVITKDFSGVRYQQDVVQTETFFNWREVPVRHTFFLTWETHSLDKITWHRLWGLGIPSACRFRVGDRKPVLTYTQNNEDSITVSDRISECKTGDTIIPPRSRATAELYVHKHDEAIVPFTLVIRKRRPNGDLLEMREAGAWKGKAYQHFSISVIVESLTALAIEV